jgi:acetyl-CoA C-acetyltransferase
VLASEPIDAASFPQDFDYQHEADRMRRPIPPTREDYEGPATIETYTVLYARDGSPKHGVIVAVTPQGERTLAKMPATDEAGIASLTDGKSEPVGTTGTIERDSAGDQIWRG